MFRYEVTSTKFNRDLFKEILVALVASLFMGFGVLFLLLWVGIYVWQVRARVTWDSRVLYVNATSDAAHSENVMLNNGFYCDPFFAMLILYHTRVQLRTHQYNFIMSCFLFAILCFRLQYPLRRHSKCLLVFIVKSTTWKLRLCHHKLLIGACCDDTQLLLSSQ